jgi:hypothetical protein
MKLNIDVLMIALLIVFIASFAIMIVYGEFWNINLSTESAGAQPPDFEHAQVAFIASCLSIASGASMLYITGKRFSEDKGKEKAVSGSVAKQ